MTVLVCYDITDNRRRSRMAKLLEGLGRRVQRSVYECDLDAAAFAALREQIAVRMNVKEDCCRVIVLCGSCKDKMLLFGKDIEPEFADLVIA